MYVYVCMYVCVCVYMHTYTYIHTYCVCAYIHIHTYLHTYIHTPWNKNLSCQWSVFSPTNISLYHLRISKEWYYILCIHSKCWVCVYVLFMFDCIIHNCLSMSVTPQDHSHFLFILIIYLLSKEHFLILMFTILHIYNNSWVCIYVSQSLPHVMVHCIALVWVCVESEM